MISKDIIFFTRQANKSLPKLNGMSMEAKSYELGGNSIKHVTVIMMIIH